MNDAKLAELEKKALDAALAYVELEHRAAPTKIQGYLTKLIIDDKAIAAAAAAKSAWIQATELWMEHLHSPGK